MRPGIAELLKHLDAIIMAQEFPTAFTGHDQLGRALQTIARDFCAPLVCVTLGKEGSLAWCGAEKSGRRHSAVDCVDSTGAGDAFRGAFAAACLRNPLDDVRNRSELRECRGGAELSRPGRPRRPAGPRRGGAIAGRPAGDVTFETRAWSNSRLNS